LVVDPPERDEKKPVLANCLMLMPNVIETEINIYIYIGIKKDTNQTKYPPVIKHGLLKNPPFVAGFPTQTSILIGDVPSLPPLM
jgi:hypothetical protein